jgi:hypothetical protein
MTEATEAMILQLVADHPALAPVLAENLEDNFDEMLPHLVMADVVRWLVARHPLEPTLCASVLGWMEARFAEDPDDVRGLIAVSGVQMIPDPGEPGSELRELLGTALQEVDPGVGDRKLSKH